MSSSLVWLTPPRLLTKSITVGMTRAISAASCSGPLGSRWLVPATSRIASSARSIRLASNGIGSISQICSQATSQPSSAAIRSDASLAVGEHVGEHVGVERALVERDLAGPVERGHDPRR